MIITLLVLLIAFQIKHLMADYYWQFPYMYLNKGAKTGWLEPLALHAGVHAGLTAMILTIWFSVISLEPTLEHKVLLFSMVVFDFITHFVTDRWKATRGRKPDESKFWTDLGIDQFVHHVVGIIIIFVTYIYI